MTRGGAGGAMTCEEWAASCCLAHLVIHELGRIIQEHVLSLRGCVPGGQGQAAQGVPASAPLLDHRHNLLLHWPRHGYSGGANSHVGTAIDDPLGGALGDQDRGECVPSRPQCEGGERRGVQKEGEGGWGIL